MNLSISSLPTPSFLSQEVVENDLQTDPEEVEVRTKQAAAVLRWATAHAQRARDGRDLDEHAAKLAEGVDGVGSKLFGLKRAQCARQPQLRVQLRDHGDSHGGRRGRAEIFGGVCDRSLKGVAAFPATWTSWKAVAASHKTLSKAMALC